MDALLLAGREAQTGEPVELEVAGDRIATVRRLTGGPLPLPRPSPDSTAMPADGPRAGGEELPWIAPGFVDLQVNGYGGRDYTGGNLSEEDLPAIVEALAASGTAVHVPTIVTAPRSVLLRNLRRIADAVDSDPLLGVAVAGIHLEGPFISADDGPRGAHPRAAVRAPDFEEYLAWEEAARGHLRYLTIAPELPGALALIERVVRRGVRVAIGHTAAGADSIRAAIDAGATISTHLGNGCGPLLPRHNNPLWEQIASDRLSAGIIADGFHLPDALIKVIARAKPAGRLFLVSDAAPLAGLAPGGYEWLGAKIEVSPAGRLSLPGGEILAGAGHLLDRGIARFMAATGSSLAEALPLATTVPAEVVGIAAERARPPSTDEPAARGVGALEAGALANLTLFFPGPDRLLIEECVVGGRVLFRRKR